MSGAPKSTARVAIVGGGLAGLAAAAGLAGRGLHIELFEARRQLGGRTGSFRDPATGMMVDHCQHVSLGCCTNFDDFCRRTGLSDLLSRCRTLHFIGPDGHRHDLAASRRLPAPLHLLPSLLRLSYLSFRDRIAIMHGLRKLAHRRNSDGGNRQAIGQWLRENGQSETAIELFWTPIVVSALSETLDRVAVPPVRKVFVDAFLADRHAYEMIVPKVPLAEFYGDRLEGWFCQHGVIVRRECSIKQVVGDVGGTKELQLGSGERMNFDAVIMAVPWRRINELCSDALKSYLPELDAASQFQAASITAVHLWFDRAITDLPHAVLLGRISQWLFNRGVHSAGAAADARGYYYQVVISASGNLAELSRDALVEEVQRDLKSIWPAARDAKLLQARMVTEQNAVFSPLPGVEQLRPPQRTAVPNLFLAGDWTATGWPATMEGAVRSGYLAAEGVLSHLGKPSILLVPDLPQPRLACWLLRTK
jgi:squalene-associated FAD-dependent desaturase